MPDQTISMLGKGPHHRGPSFLREPIFALSSPAVKSAVAVVRLSGEGCHQLLDRCLADPPAIAKRQMRRLYLTAFKDPASGETIDQPLVVWFRGPHSFTGEDCAELHLHGGLYILRRAAAILRQAGFRDAEPGEFTKRAYVNGKMDLAVAEGLREIIDAETKEQHDAARQMAEGRISAAIDQLRHHVLQALAFLEAQIDFPDEGETKGLTTGPANEAVRQAHEGLIRLQQSYRSGRVARDGLKIAIVGAPNAGKSTLLNQLLGHDRAIVTPIAGTTRDYLEERCLIEGRMVRLIDTAGIRSSEDTIEQRGIELSSRQAEDADIVLWLTPSDASDGDGGEMQRLRNIIPAEKIVSVLTKLDLTSSCERSRFDLAISCHTGEGLQELQALLAARLDALVGDLEANLVITNERHLHLIGEALQGIDAYQQALQNGEFAEILAAELMGSARALAALIGKIDTDDILDVIFSQFCIGK